MGQLSVVGTGIMFPAQMTFEAAEHIRAADVVLFNVGPNPVICDWIRENAKHCIDLYDFYGEGKRRDETYRKMVDAIVSEVEAGKKVVAAFYGHPGIFVGPGFEAIKECRRRGLSARMLPGVSAVDCMHADLEFDPAQYGCTMIEATDYVVLDRSYDTNVPLIIWQAGVVADMTFQVRASAEHSDLLQKRLLQDYPPEHPVYAYVASTIPGLPFQIREGTIGTITDMALNASVTCLVPPIDPAEIGEGIGRQALEIMQAALDTETA